MPPTLDPCFACGFFLWDLAMKMSQPGHSAPGLGLDSCPLLLECVLSPACLVVPKEYLQKKWVGSKLEHWVELLFG